MERKIFLKQYLEIMGVFIMIQGLALILGYWYKTTTPQAIAQANMLFTTWQSAVIYILYITAAGLILAGVFKYGEKIKEFIVRISTWLYSIALIKSIVDFIKYHKRLLESIFWITLIIFLIGLVIYLLITVKGDWILFVASSIFLVIYYILPKSIASKMLLIAFNTYVAFIFGISFSFPIAVLFFVLLAIYDFVAVFITKHMIILAKGIQNQSKKEGMALITGLMMYTSTQIYGIEPDSLPAEVKEKYENNKSRWKKSMKTLAISGKGIDLISPTKETSESTKKKLTDIYNNGKFPAISQVALGSGDLVFPAIITISAFSISMQAPIILLLGSILGLGITFGILHVSKRALPAIPTIGIGILIGLAVIFL